MCTSSLLVGGQKYADGGDRPRGVVAAAPSYPRVPSSIGIDLPPGATPVNRTEEEVLGWRRGTHVYRAPGSESDARRFYRAPAVVERLREQGLVDTGRGSGLTLRAIDPNVKDMVDLHFERNRNYDVPVVDITIDYVVDDGRSVFAQ